MHLGKLLLESFTSNSFNAVLLPCDAPFKLIEVGTDINIMTSFIAALLSCSSVSTHFTNLEFGQASCYPLSGITEFPSVLTRLSIYIDEVNVFVLDVASDHCLSLKLFLVHSSSFILRRLGLSS